MRINDVEFNGHVLGWTITDAEQKTNIVDLAGASGRIDLSTVVTGGEPVYNVRTLSIAVRETVPAGTASAVYNQRLQTWHGRELRITPDDRDSYWQGRVALSSPQKAYLWLGYNISAVVQPWRYDALETVVTVNATADPGTVFGLLPTNFTVVPLVTSVNANTIHIGTAQYSIPSGATNLAIPGLVLRPLTIISGRVVGAGTVTFRWRGGELN